MLRRSLPTLLLAAALLVPSAASAREQHFAPLRADEAASPHELLTKAERTFAGRGQVDGYELTPLLKELAAAAPELDAPERRRAMRLLARPTQGETTGSEAGYTVPEGRPLCGVHFCIHWVPTTEDAPPDGNANGNDWPDYVETMSSTFEYVYAVENERLGWRPPQPDGARGCPNADPACMDRTDVYILDVGEQSIYGYAAPDPRQASYNQSAYLVMDDDYAAAEFPSYGGDPLAPMQVTAAHEYNHVLQFGYDVAQDTWMFEATATWMEDVVYTHVDDYLQYLPPWAQLSFVPLTSFDSIDSSNPDNVKVYGDMVWNRWLERHYGQAAVRNAWESSLMTEPTSFAPGAYDASLERRGSSFFQAFSRFAVDTAEWRASNSPFAEGSSFPDMARVRDGQTGQTIRLVPDGPGAGGQLPHTTFGLLDVPLSQAPRIKFVLEAPRGRRMALALVGRAGDEVSGTSSVALTRLPRGGTGTATLTDPARFSRITAVIVNADARTTGRYSRTYRDWEWVGDDATVSSRLSTDFRAPVIRRRSPRPGQRRVSLRPRVRIKFSERVANIGSRTAVLRAPGGRRVSAKVVSRSGGRGLEIRPRRRLRPGARYRVRLGAGITDSGANRLPKSLRRWSFSTAR
jgi:hypothetical protein